MDTEEMVDGALTLKGDILEGAEEAFNHTRYVEAFALLHAYIDWLMTSNIQLRTNHPFNDEYRFMKSAKLLKDTYHEIDQIDFDKLQKFNDLRDLIIHRLVRYSFQHREISYYKDKAKTKLKIEKGKVTKAEVDEGFKEGKALANMLEEKNSKAYGRLVRQIITV